MRITAKLAVFTALGTAFAAGEYAQAEPTFWESIKNPAVAAQLKSFVATKVAQADAATSNMPPEFVTFFDAAQAGNWSVVSNTFYYVGQHNGQFLRKEGLELPRGTAWDALQEIWGAYRAFGPDLTGTATAAESKWVSPCMATALERGNEKYSTLFGDEVIQSVPAGSIYFGGTDPGRFIITALEKSEINGDPFFTFTQNALADETYVDYLRSMYGEQIYIPTPADLQGCFNEYYSDVQQRLKNHQLKPGENARLGRDGKLQVSGQIAVMEINGLIARIIFEKEPNREFYVEESYPLEWMYPYLEPHGLIFKLNHKAISELSEEMVRRDHDYWVQTVSPMIGNWLNNDTSVASVATFTEKVYLRQDLESFGGDPEFIENSYSSGMFSKERCSIAGLYEWRAEHSHDAAEKKCMSQAADFAFRQAWALCPYSEEPLYRYVQFLMDEGRSSDALLLAETTGKFSRLAGGVDPKQVQDLKARIRQYQKDVKQYREPTTSETRSPAPVAN